MTVVEPTLIPSSDKFDSLAEPPSLATPDFADTPENRELVGKVYHLFSTAREHRRPLVPRWDRAYRMIFNRYWTKDRPGWMPSPQLPEILPILRSLVGFQFDQRVTHVVSPAMVPGIGGEEWFAQRADDLETVLGASWHVNYEEREWTLAGWDGWVYGTGIMKTAWEGALAGGMGDAMSRRIDPRSFYPDPNAKNEHDGDFYLEAKIMSVEALDRRFPGTYELFKDGQASIFNDVDEAPTQIDLAGGDGRSKTRANPAALSPSTTPNYFQSGSGRMSDDTDMPGVTVIECWVREHNFEEVTDERTGEKAKVAVENWRVIVVAGDRVLMNEEARNLWGHGQHPYSRYCPLEIGEFWGPSLVEALIPSQQSINRILAALQQNVELTGNPIWKDAATQGSRTPHINRPGQRVRLPQGQTASSVGWENPPPLNQGMLELLRYHLARMEAISGVTAMQKGQVPGGRNAEGTIESVQESAFVTIREAQRNLEYAMRDAGYKKAALVTEFYTQPRMIAVAGNGGEKTSIMLGALHFHLPSENGTVPMKYQLLVDAGSRRHTSRQILEERAIQMFTLGLLPPTDTLEAIGWPRAREVGAKIEEQQALAAQAEADKRTKARA